MKLYKYFIIIACTLLLSCSNDEGQNITFLDANVQGTTHLFNTFHVSKQTSSDEEGTHQLVTVTASVERSLSHLITFTAEQYETDQDACWYFACVEDGVTYERFDDSFTFEVVENTKERIRGIFSGQLKSPETGEIISVKGGTFDVFHH